MKTKIIVFIFASVLAVTVISCQTLLSVAESGTQNASNALIASGKAISSAVEEITPEQEYYIGRAVAANILSTYKIWNGNPTLTSYLNLVCTAITINSPRPDIYNGYHVAILDSNEINAFATSGGHIYVTRGLINAAKSEDALAGVIAHEVAHIQLRHGIKAIRNSRITQALIVTGASAAGAVTGMDVNQLTDVFNESIGEIVSTMLSNGYSKVQEFDADNTAMKFMASAGYNPSGLIDMLKELSKVQTSSSGLGKTHPTPDQRISNAERSVKLHKVTDTSSNRQKRFASATK